MGRRASTRGLRSGDHDSHIITMTGDGCLSVSVRKNLAVVPQTILQTRQSITLKHSYLNPKAQRQIGSCMNTVLLMLAGLQGRKEA